MAGFWSSVGSGVSNYFSSGSGWSDLLGGVVSGLAGSAAANRQDDRAAQDNTWAIALQALRGEQDLQRTAFERELEDFYERSDTQRDKVALDTFGQFSVMNRRSPGYKPPAATPAPVKPRLEDYRGS